MPLPRFDARHVRGRLRSGSSSPVVVETAAGLFVAKLRGAGQGVLALIAEIISAEIAERLALAVPARALIDLPPETRSDDRNDELADLLRASIGLNLGFRLLPGAREASAQDVAAFDDEFVARVLWLDGLTMNPDRTRTNPNVLMWNDQPWLIDHGAALPFHHDWARVSEDSPRVPMNYARHVFNQRLNLLPRFDSTLAAELSREALLTAIGNVPDSLLEPVNGRSAARNRAAYHAFLWKRLKSPRPFVGATGSEG